MIITRILASLFVAMVAIVLCAIANASPIFAYWFTILVIGFLCGFVINQIMKGNV